MRVAALLCYLLIACVTAFGQSLPKETAIGNLEPVAYFNGPMPTGVTVSQTGRIFITIPRWGDPVDFTVAEVRDGRAVAYPNAAINRPNEEKPAESLFTVQSAVVDARDRLWMMDTGTLLRGPVTPGGAKLIGVDLQQNRIFKNIPLPPEVALPTSYLNDIRFDLRRGKEGMAFITDSSLSGGPNAIIVVDLTTGRSWRKLNDHASTKAEADFLPIVEGQPLMLRPPNGEPLSVRVGADGIAISSDGARLFYCPLSSRKLYSVSVDALADEKASDEAVAATVTNHGEKGASDGLESDSEGRVYVTDYEHNAIRRRLPSGMYETLVHDPRVLWPDTLSISHDGYLYFIVNQLHRQPVFHGGKDRRQKPYTLFRVRVDVKPVLLR